MMGIILTTGMFMEQYMTVLSQCYNNPEIFSKHWVLVLANSLSNVVGYQHWSVGYQHWSVLSPVDAYIQTLYVHVIPLKFYMERVSMLQTLQYMPCESRDQSELRLAERILLVASFQSFRLLCAVIGNPAVSCVILFYILQLRVE